MCEVEVDSVEARSIPVMGTSVQGLLALENQAADRILRDGVSLEYLN
jgi:hypothetical protein